MWWEALLSTVVPSRDSIEEIMKNLVTLAEWQHTSPALTKCALWALGLSLSFVLNLYLLVPRPVRRLPRDDPRHIQWRMISTGITVLVSLIIYPYLFTERESDQVPMTSLWNLESFHATLHHLGFWGRRSGFHWGYVLHALMPYFGSIVNFLLEIHYRVSIYNISTRHTQKPKAHYILQVIETFVQRLFLPFRRRTYGSGPWAGIRNILVAPLVEEVIFRACTITPYLHTIAYTSGQVSMTTVCWTTPLFFGLAHVHHAFRMMRSHENPKRILIQTAFQFLYTTLFGAYASLWYIKTRSIGVVFLLHSFCNYMGLPSMYFTGGVEKGMSVDLPHLYHICRRIVLLSFVAGGLGFVLGFTRFWNPFERL